MLRSILVCLGGAFFSKGALDLALRWAKRFHAAVTGLTVLDRSHVVSHVAIPAVGMPYNIRCEGPLLEEAERRIEDYADHFRRACRDAEVEFALVRDEGRPCQILLQEALRHDLIVMGREGHWGTPENPRETLHRVLRHAPCPTVVVPGDTPASGVTLIAWDASRPAARALQSFVAMGLEAEGTVWVLCIHDTSPEVAEDLAGRACDFLAHHGVQAAPRPMVSDAPAATVILREAERLGAGLVVMGAHGHARVVELLVGSVTARVLRDTRVPLFLTH